MSQDKTIKGVMETKIQQALARGYCYTQTEMKVLDPDLIQAMSIEVNKLFQQEIKLALESVVPEEKKLKQRETYLTLGGSLTNMYVEDDKISGYNQAIDEIKENIKHYLE